LFVDALMHNSKYYSVGLGWRKTFNKPFSISILLLKAYIVLQILNYSCINLKNWICK
jgi:hypothetical protein